MDMTAEELGTAIAAAVEAALAPFKAKVDALVEARGRVEVPDADQQVAIERFARAYVEGRLGADNDTVQ